MLSKHARITGMQRRQLGVALRRAYVQGVSIRTLARTCGRSFGFVRRLLIEAGAVMSPRGGRILGQTGQSARQIEAATRLFESELGVLCGKSST
ncbi:helix-turn-helix domain-containing protein [Streptomyces sp. NPDC002851]